MYVARSHPYTSGPQELTSSVVLTSDATTAQEVGLTPGLAYERRLFQALFSTEDQKEGQSSSSPST